MICHEFKCGIGTSSRRVERSTGDTYTLGVAGAGELRHARVPAHRGRARSGRNSRSSRRRARTAKGDTGSIIIVVATDAPLLPHQLKRVAKRAALGLARMGSFAGNGSGDIFIAFSTANAAAFSGTAAGRVRSRSPTTTSIPVRRDRAGDRGGDRQRDGRGARHARHGRALCAGAAARCTGQRC